MRPFLNDLKNEGCLNAMHILLVYLQQAPAEQRPLAAAILLQIDLLVTNTLLNLIAFILSDGGLAPEEGGGNVL